VRRWLAGWLAVVVCVQTRAWRGCMLLLFLLLLLLLLVLLLMLSLCFCSAAHSRHAMACPLPTPASHPGLWPPPCPAQDNYEMSHVSRASIINRQDCCQDRIRCSCSCWPPLNQTLAVFNFTSHGSGQLQPA
jgi:hypothetical protein